MMMMSPYLAVYISCPKAQYNFGSFEYMGTWAVGISRRIE